MFFFFPLYSTILLFLCGLHYQRYNMISSHITQHAHYRLSILRPAHNKRLLLYNNVCLSIFTIVSILYILINDLILVSINKLLYFIILLSDKNKLKVLKSFVYADFKCFPNRGAYFFFWIVTKSKLLYITIY